MGQKEDPENAVDRNFIIKRFSVELDERCEDLDVVTTWNRRTYMF